mgnify:CR=1 FL=1
MSLSVEEIVYMQSTGGLGGALTTPIPEESLHNIFDAVSGKEAKLGDTEYRCVYIKNTNTEDTLYNAVLFILTQPTGSKEHVQIARGTAPTNATEQTVLNENTAPLGVTFVDAPDLENGVVLGDIPPNGHRSIWIKREISSNAPVSRNSRVFLAISGDIF